MEITKEVLINELFEGETNQFTTGYNAAIITLLKKINQPEQGFETSLLTKFKNVMFASNYEYHFKQLKAESIKEILMAVEANTKLQAVKALKEYSGLGLKEAKDVIDQLM